MINVEDCMYDNFMDYEKIGSVIIIDESMFIHVESDEGVIDENLSLILSSSDEAIAEKYSDKNPNYVFEWGGRFCYRPCSEYYKPIFTQFAHIGKSVSQINMDFINLGVHGRYELMNGTREYKDWCKKAKFFNQDALGICEKSTLAGTLSFQSECEKAGIQSILGETFRVDGGDYSYNLKMYVKDQQGWENILNFNKISNVDNSKYIEPSDLINEDASGLICVIEPTKHLSSDLIYMLKDKFDKVYFQIDLSEFSFEEIELERLDSMKRWHTNFSSIVQPILINDSYYLDSTDSRIKPLLNSSGVKGEYFSKNQHFKHIEELFLEWSELWSEDKRQDMISIFKKSVRNTQRLAMECEFKIDTNSMHLPEYVMTEEESSKYSSNEDMFMSLIKEGVDRLIDPNKFSLDEVWSRIDKEVKVIKKGGFIDYFLMTRDILNWANNRNIITGIGRGSAAGCLVSYTLGIVLLNPLEYDLLFERFLNEARMGDIVNTDAWIVEFDNGTQKEFLSEEDMNLFVKNFGN